MAGQPPYNFEAKVYGDSVKSLASAGYHEFDKLFGSHGWEMHFVEIKLCDPDEPFAYEAVFYGGQKFPKSKPKPGEEAA